MSSLLLKVAFLMVKDVLGRIIPGFRAKNRAKQDKSDMHFLKAAVYLIGLSMTLPHLPRLMEHWGHSPQWLFDEDDNASIHGSMILMTTLLPALYIFELVQTPKPSITMWMHHMAVVLFFLYGTYSERATGNAITIDNCVVFLFGFCTLRWECMGLCSSEDEPKTKALLMKSAIGPYCLRLHCHTLCNCLSRTLDTIWRAAQPDASCGEWPCVSSSNKFCRSRPCSKV